ncbi:hypothetical protein [Phocaeicola vulgatus]|uniref:hypothetical protein n=1 Tax=Phocaeicola vulgatus TaxID=821 RepID=UPI0018A06EDF|nr:hypothetical protein [Phocaeicola vulgatus]MCI7758191.1 hypothetical protein [Phocaeicola vulgatus]
MGSLIPQATKRSFESARYFSKLIGEKRRYLDVLSFASFDMSFLTKTKSTRQFASGLARYTTFIELG